MKIEKVETLKIELSGKDADNFKSALKSIVQNNNQIGYTRNVLSKDEVDVIQEINNKLLP